MFACYIHFDMPYGVGKILQSHLRKMNSSLQHQTGLIPTTNKLTKLVVLFAVGVIISCSDSPANDGPIGGEGDALTDQGVIRPQPDSSTDDEDDDDAALVDAALDPSTDATGDGVDDEEIGPQPPVANAGDDVTTRAGTPVELSASASYDPDGTIVSYEWTFGDGTSDVGEVVFHTYDTHGAYIVQLTVTDDDDLTDTDTLLANIQEFNEAPRAVIRSPDVIVAGEEAELNASDSTDDGTITSYAWNVGVEGVDPIEGETLNYTWVDWGPYTVGLTVTDDLEQTDTYNLPIDVLARPTAVITAPSTGLVGVGVDFSSLNSTDEDGSIASQHWLFPDDGSESSGTLPSHTFLTVGEWEVVLTVTDDDDLTHTVTHKIAILPPPNVCPTAVIDLGDPPHEWYLDESVEPSGTGSSDTDGSILTYDWDWGDGSPVEHGSTSTHSYATYDTFTITLTVTDSDLCTYVESDPTTALARTTAEVVIVNETPTAVLDTTPAHVEGNLHVGVGQPILFDGSGSTDDSGLISRTLAFGDAFSAPLTGPSYTVEHSYASADTYTATLTVRDDQEVTNTAEVEIVVSDFGAYSGTFDVDLTAGYPCSVLDDCNSIVYDCYTLVNVEFTGLNIVVSADGGVTVSPIPPAEKPGEMTGNMNTPTSFTVENRIGGGPYGCEEIYRLAAIFSDADHFTGIFEVDFSGAICGVCTPSGDIAVTGVRE